MEISFYDLLLFGHLISLVIGFGSVIVVDSFGLAWLCKLFGVTLKLVTMVANITQKLIWLGFGGLVLTGSLMLLMRGEISNLFWLKAFLVAMVGVNGVFLHSIKKLMESEASEVPSRQVMFKIALASTISQVGWWGATLIGFASKELGVSKAWPVAPVAVMLVVVACIAVFFAVGQTWANKKNN